MANQPVTARPALTRTEAQRRVDRIRAFREELAALEAEGILRLPQPDGQALATYHGALLREFARRFDVDRTQTERQMSLGMRVASLVGAVAFSIAVFLFFYRFWGALSVPIQLVLLVAAPVAAAIGVEIAARRDKTLYFASLFAVVACASFVLDLTVVASIFNLPASPNGFLVWAAFAFALAYGYRLRLLLLVGIVLGGIWVAATVTSFTGTYWVEAILRPENAILAGALSLAGGAPHGKRGEEDFARIYRLIGCAAVLVPIFFLSEWDGLSYIPLPGSAVPRLYDVVGFAAGAAVVWVAIRHQRTDAMNVGAAFLVLFLCLKLFDWCWDWMPRYLFFLTIGVVAIALIAILQRLRVRRGGGAGSV